MIQSLVCMCKFLQVSTFDLKVNVLSCYIRRGSAEEALKALNGAQIGGRSVRLSWGRSPSNRPVLFSLFLFGCALQNMSFVWVLTEILLCWNVCSLNLNRTSGVILLIMDINKGMTPRTDMCLPLKILTCTMVVTRVMVGTQCLSKPRCPCNSNRLVKNSWQVSTKQVRYLGMNYLHIIEISYLKLYLLHYSLCPYLFDQFAIFNPSPKDCPITTNSHGSVPH